MRIPFFAVVLCLSLPIDALHAQSGDRSGAWMNVGVGGGSARVSCAVCRQARDIGPAGHVRFGGTVRPGVLIGGEVQVWTHQNGNDVRSLLGSALASVQLYPRPGSGFFLRGGLGYVRYTARDGDEDGPAAADLPGLSVGAGYDLRLRGGLSLTNVITLLASSQGPFRRDGASIIDEVSVSMLQLGIGLTRH
jgi:hypothetical protein